MNTAHLGVSAALLTALFFVPVLAQDVATSRPASQPDAIATERAPEDAHLAAWRVELVDLAYRAVSKMPSEPHIKSRSRAQEDVVDVALEMGLPLRAATYAKGIANWRAAAAHADVAKSLIDMGLPVAGRKQMAAAEGALETVQKEETQGWRTSRVQAKLAACDLALGEVEEALRRQVELADSETSFVEEAKAKLLTVEAFDAQYERARSMIDAANFDQLKAILATCKILYSRFFDDEVRREQVISLAESAWKSLPIDVRIETRFSFARSAMAHANPAIAVQLVDAADGLRQRVSLNPELTVTLAARFAGMRAEVGQPTKALQEANGALALFTADKKKIVDIYRGRTLRPLAEAYCTMGESEKALEVYRMALDEGFVNPNSRPRADDLAATCLSMALRNTEPSTDLWKRIVQIEGALAKPW